MAQEAVNAAVPICTPSVPGLEEQVDNYLRTNSRSPEYDMALLQIGGNDLLIASTQDDPAAGKAIVDAALDGGFRWHYLLANSMRDMPLLL